MQNYNLKPSAFRLTAPQGESRVKAFIAGLVIGIVILPLAGSISTSSVIDRIIALASSDEIGVER